MLESILLVVSLCIDAFIASFAYGTSKIKIPFLSGTVITCISTLFLIISLSLGSLIKIILPANITLGICFGILFLLGISRLFEGVLKNFLCKKALSSDHIEFTLFDFKLILNVYADSILADIDHSKILSMKEALYLGIALSLDSLVVGLGAGLDTFHFYEITIFSLVFNAISLLIGGILGRKFAQKLNIDLSWMSGAVLIVLAILKLL
ncbi:sporulation membrane protein YtaF [Cellulosilyticum sp. I15G10I2]|uniref:sporulation membrane protein YtaF n=1 Tax=Cellulosilyticum sp. I15G10I2 TaxID=1892843 RepID=UPI00085C3B2F|nr:sporulation membrane protein YtaF [Cellulosilyticum sp. I15G10I2]